MQWRRPIGFAYGEVDNRFWTRHKGLGHSERNSTRKDSDVYTQQPAPTEDSGAPQRTDVRAALLGGTTFRSLSEQTLSPREEKFERTRQTIGLFLAPVVAVVFALLPLNLD